MSSSTSILTQYSEQVIDFMEQIHPLTEERKQEVRDRLRAVYEKQNEETWEDSESEWNQLNGGAL